MSFRPSPARAPAALLRDAKPLKALFHQARRLEQLQQLLESQLQPAARAHCKVASWRDGCLLLVITDGHWATRLRYQQRRLQRQLAEMQAFAGLARILFKVQPPIPDTPRPAAVPPLTRHAADGILSAADGISDPRLREALERLARHTSREERE
ncbi:DciA family protein [Stutzerimonas kirkiae]|uniref:DUF721 domain-containing protein n=1 Tax=Stutzerimonas kirkiae TaxID=2211392 RepID=A0A4Q9QX54_9GAMM|nr:DciA family protein [Stutzerimonas kirkiae]TBU87815.1 DUF721 domain-containing protein [Stutzerimonas kirkiae]TBU98047.1 DUF721 domain-containing protein [Stutzerimonas kirkiae]TBV06924.1 DUF721 domain-containing protein [Stutzerimonas kirkiae]TBV16194.1 DUF721 domain-containing protein [Stutzerimonas kirkiae]